MSDHPTRTTLQGFRRAHLAQGDMRSVLHHLMGRCERCRRTLRELGVGERRDAASGAPAVEAAYDSALSSAFSFALARRGELERERAGAPTAAADLLALAAATPAEQISPRPGFWTWGLCEALLARSRALRHEDPEGTVRAAELATLAAERLEPGRHGRAALADLKAQAWAELANACRIADRLERADAAILRAIEHRRQGSGDPLLLARLADLTASLRCHQRRFPEAFRLLDIAHALYLAHGDSHNAGRTLIKKGVYTGHDNDPRGAIRLLASGLAAIDRARDPKLVFSTLHNLIDFLVEIGECREARLQLWKMRQLYRAHGGRLDFVKLRWLEGQIAAGLGELDHAERDLASAWRELHAAGLDYHAAIAGLDLAQVWVRLGRTAEVRSLAEQLVASFRSRQVEREALAALLTLAEAARQERATLGLVRLVADQVRRLERRRGLDRPVAPEAARSTD